MTGPSSSRKEIHATYQLHRGPVSITKLVVSKQDGEIVLDPQITDGCVISLEEDSAIILRDMLTEWLW